MVKLFAEQAEKVIPDVSWSSPVGGSVVVGGTGTTRSGGWTTTLFSTAGVGGGGGIVLKSTGCPFSTAFNITSNCCKLITN